MGLKLAPSNLPTEQPSNVPTKIPSMHPSTIPTRQPTVTCKFVVIKAHYTKDDGSAGKTLTDVSGTYSREAVKFCSVQAIFFLIFRNFMLQNNT